MVGLEKSKAAAGETSQSARALTLEDMHKLFNLCIGSEELTASECRWGVVRYVSTGHILCHCLSFLKPVSKTIYLLAWLILLRIEEATHLEFESIDFHPGERMSLWDYFFICDTLIHPVNIGCYFEVKLRTRKSAQTGVSHTWKLYANDSDVQICPVRAILRLARLYGPNISCKGPLFLRVNSSGGVMQDQPVVCLFLDFSPFTVLIIALCRLVPSLAVP